MTEIDYATIAIISAVTSFVGAIGSELAKAAMRYVDKLRRKMREQAD